MNISPAKLFKFFAVAEMITWSMLITGLILRATVGIPSELFTLIGGSHGFTFLGYGVVAALVGVNQRWKLPKIVLGIVLAIVPFATFPFERSLAKTNSLAGDWRTTKTSDPRDSGWFDSLFRWFIARPVILVLVLALTVVSLFSTLLVLGPPSEWGN
jgi:integral membrane protein